MNISLADLNGRNGFRFDGIDGGDESGTSVASAGDVNGDGFDDVIIGAPRASADGIGGAGTSSVVFGRAGGFAASLSSGALDGTNGFRLGGTYLGDYSGTSVASAGDVNGDGLGDLIIGAPNAGANYVVFGQAGGFAADVSLDLLDGANGFRLDGASFITGSSVASAGDVNGDGFDDLIIGEYLANPGGQTTAGQSFVVFGQAGGFAANLSLGALDGSDGFRLDGVAERDFSGFSVASAGDVNGDGFDDVIIGAFLADPDGRDRAGSSYVVFGKSGGFDASLSLGALDGNNGFRVDGIGAGDFSGQSVASAGDVNGDGIDDLIIGAYNAGGSPGENYGAGESYVVFGTRDGFAASLSLGALDGSNGFRLDGADGGDYSGFSVASAGDVNGDGLGDLIIGALRASPGGAFAAGSSFVVFGSTQGFAASLDLSDLNGVNGFRIDGVAAVDESGSSVASAGDVNGDGFDDLIIGAPEARPGGLRDAGSSFVVFGFATPITRVGTAGNDTLAGLGADDTLDGAGGDDLLRGAGGDDVLQGGAGRDVLLGGLGRDTLDGGAGGDRINGGGGVDLVSYASAIGAVTADFATGLFRAAGQARDRVTGVEGAIGSGFDDRLVGGTAAVTLSGGGGADRVTGGNGADRLFGGVGDDRIGGGAGDDTLVGGIGDDTLSGGFGGDTLSGGAGDDTLTGGLGSDVLTGGGGGDRFVFARGFGQDRITDFADGLDRLDFSAHSGVADFSDLTLTALGPDVEIRDGAGGVLVLANTALTALGAEDFLF